MSYMNDSWAVSIKNDNNYKKPPDQIIGDFCLMSLAMAGNSVAGYRSLKGMRLVFLEGKVRLLKDWVVGTNKSIRGYLRKHASGIPKGHFLVPITCQGPEIFFIVC